MSSSFQSLKLVFVFLFCLGSTQLFAQKILTNQQWQEDLAFLQETVHKDHSFLFKKVSAADFDAEVAKLKAAIPTMADHEVMVGLQRIVSLFKYGHTDMGFKGAIPYHKLPINLYDYKDGMYIEGGHQSQAKVIGAKVIAIEGMSISDALEKIKPTVPIENAHYFKAFGISNLLIPEVLHAQRITSTLQKKITFTLEKNGSTFQHTFDAWKSEDVPRTEYSRMKVEGEWLSARSQEVTPLYLKDLDKIYYYEYLAAEKTVYVRHSKIRDDSEENIKAFYKRVFEFIENNDVEKFILDVRLNGGGNNFLNKPIITGVIESKKINQPGKFITIIGRRTFSACQNLVNRLNNYTNVTFVGEMSSENVNFYGDARTYKLPNSEFPVYLSFAWWQDNAPWDNPSGMIPEVPVMMTFDEYASNKDPELEAALAFKVENAVIDPMERLTELFTAGKMGEVEAEAARMIKDPAYSYYDFESEFVSAADQLLTGGNLQGGMFVLQLVTKSFPESGPAWATMGKGLEMMKDAGKAKEMYQKALQLDPKGTAGKMAKERLMALEKE